MKLSSNRAGAGRRLALASGAALAALVGVAVPRPAHAQWAVACVNCATMWTQALEYGKQLQQVATQLQQYQTQLNQYQNMIQNTVALPQQAWNTVQSDIMQVRALSNAASMLTGNTGSILTRLQSGSAYANQAASLGNIAGQFTTWQQTIGNNVSTLGRTLGLQQSQQQSDAALLAQLQQHSQSATGQMQAIQAGNELASANGAQLMQIQATLAATAQMVGSNDAVTADRRASEDAAMLRFTTPQPVPLTGYRQW